ncbi:c2 domain-containing protein [Ditylenchus destructor]|nr:c2 domain-containing protein [Ditylenchus destructor]
MLAMASNAGDQCDAGMPDLSHLSEEERAIILQVLQRQKAEEQKEEEIAQRADKELDDIERQINERKENAQRLVGTQDDAICQICQKTKFADGIGHKCFYCQLRSCARCGGKTTSKNKNIWACSLCQKRQQILARTGKWFQNPTNEPVPATTAFMESPTQSSRGSTTSQQLAEHKISVPSGPATVPETHQRTVSDSSGRRPSATRQPSLKNRQNSLHRQPSLEADHHNQQPLMNGGGGRAATVTGHNGSGPTQQRQTTGLPGTSHVSNGPIVGQQQRHADHRDNTQRDNLQQTKKPGKQIATTSHGNAVEQSIEDVERRRAPDSAAKAPPMDRLPATSKKSFDERYTDFPRQNGPKADRYPAESRKVRSGQPARTRTGSTQSIAPSPLAVPPPEKPSTSTTATVITAHAQKSPVPPRSRRTKMPRQTRSFSSSDDEDHVGSHIPLHQQNMPSSSSLHSHSTSALQDQDFSEKDLLRYIYGNQNFAKNGKNGTPLFDSSIMDAARASGAGISAGNLLATKIRNYLSNPVSWQPSTDQKRLIGHMVLTRSSQGDISALNSATDFGLKVIGGRHSGTGRLGTFITKVKSGSLADTVGQLRPSDEVLEWNGHCLQNLTHDQVYNIVNSTKNDTKLELIVSRPANFPGNDDFLNVRRISTASHFPLAESSIYDSRGLIDPSVIGAHFPHHHATTGGYPSPYGASNYSKIPHSMSLVAAPHHKFSAQLHDGRTASPLVFQRTHSGYIDPALLPANHTMMRPGSSAQICGKIEISLLYLIHKRELVVTLHRAYDLVPRPDGTTRNPYVKLFLLPDRSEKSRRQSVALAETLEPVWNESFYYYDLTEPVLVSRVLEVTVWDYDKYEAHSFLGETLIDLSQTLLDNQPFSYILLDMDDENPIRMRLRQRRYSSQTPPIRSRSQTSHYTSPSVQRHSQGYEVDDYFDSSYSVHNLPQYATPNVRRSRTYHRGGAFADPATTVDWNKNSASGSGYLSDHSQYYSQMNQHPHRRPRSATALRNVAEIEDPDQPYLPPYEMDQLSMGDYGVRHNGPYEYSQQHRENHGFHEGNVSTNGRTKGRSRHEILQEQSVGGYGSDGSETLSVNSANSMQNRALNRARERQYQQQQNQISERVDDANDDGSIDLKTNASMRPHHQNTTSTEEYGMEDTNMSGNGTSIPGNKSGSSSTVGAAALLAKQRKKSIMTRFIPGRNGSSESNKRMGFARSEEVGVSEALCVPGDALPNNTFTKQTSKESTDSDNWLPILPDGQLGSFVENLGPSQVVGRQALASPIMGEISVKLWLDSQLGIAVEVLDAKNLVMRQNTKIAPAPYIKAYLMEGKNCIAKAKTQSSRKSATSLVQHTMAFGVFDPKRKMLQLSVLADYGRMERKEFMGIAQINLDELDMSQPVSGWYKLFHRNSLVAGNSTASGGPIRKDSENSLNDMR